MHLPDAPRPTCSAGLPTPTSFPPDVLQVHQYSPPLQTEVFLGWCDKAGFWKGKGHTSGLREATGLLGAYFTLTSPVLRGDQLLSVLICEMETVTLEYHFDEQLLVGGPRIQLSGNAYLTWVTQRPAPLRLAVILSLPEADPPGRGKKQHSVLLPALC